jgi:hypothetical protein
MTAKEKEIREAERKAMTEVRKWKLKESKKLAGMTTEEFDEYCRKGAEELKAEGFKVAFSL